VKQASEAMAAAVVSMIRVDLNITTP